MGRVIARVLVLLGLLAAESGCTFTVSGSAMDGRVVDETSGKPIAGALVIAEWSGDVGGPVQSSQVCFHLEIATTDADGRYRIPGWSRRPVADWEGGFFGLRNIEVTRRTYKDGYTQLRYDPKDVHIILMSKFIGDVDSRLDFLSRQGTVGCGAADGSLVRELTLWSAICNEVRHLPAASAPQIKYGNGPFLRLIDVQVAAIGRQLQEYDHALANASLEHCNGGGAR